MVKRTADSTEFKFLRINQLNTVDNCRWLGT